MNSKNIIIGLYNHFRGLGYAFFSCNTNALWHEADFVAVNKSMYVTECEIKISRSDFKADFKKEDKHRGFIEKTSTVNYFYYACPEGLIKVEEVPEYAGLIYITEGQWSSGVPRYTAWIQKKAPLMHKNKISDSKLIALLRSVMFKYFTNSNTLTNQA